MTRESGSAQLSGWEFERLVALLLKAEFGEQSVSESGGARDPGFDFVVRKGRSRRLIEAKVPTPQTLGRATGLAAQLASALERYGRRDGDVMAVIVVPGAVSPRFKEPFQRQNIEVWDRDWIEELISRHRSRASEELIARIARYESTERAQAPTEAEALAARLAQTPCGRADAYFYQDLCVEIFDLLFCPPLEKPLTENRNESGVNRRDIILPNYASDGFWQFMRDAYRADYVVLDAKNLCGGVKKTHVLQLANYLESHGTGLFGMLLTRTGSERSAEIVRREQWAVHHKLILVLTDDDLRQMLLAVGAGESPEGSIRQKIEAFRLGV